jgi:hypothetical protein
VPATACNAALRICRIAASRCELVVAGVRQRGDPFSDALFGDFKFQGRACRPAKFCAGAQKADRTLRIHTKRNRNLFQTRRQGFFLDVIDDGAEAWHEGIDTFAQSPDRRHATGAVTKKIEIAAGLTEMTPPKDDSEISTAQYY